MALSLYVLEPHYTISESGSTLCLTHRQSIIENNHSIQDFFLKTYIGVVQMKPINVLLVNMASVNDTLAVDHELYNRASVLE